MFIHNVIAIAVREVTFFDAFLKLFNILTEEGRQALRHFEAVVARRQMRSSNHDGWSVIRRDAGMIDHRRGDLANINGIQARRADAAHQRVGQITRTEAVIAPDDDLLCAPARHLGGKTAPHLLGNLQCERIPKHAANVISAEDHCPRPSISR